MAETKNNFKPNEKFMLRAIELAKKGKGWTNPNPLVGAVIVRDEKIISEGYHHKCGDLHAERDAIKNARENGIDIADSTIYVTLEPCCHQGRQPPCVEAIVESGIKCVVIGSRDPNPLVNGGGVDFLKKNGVTVIQDFLKDECNSINQVFFHYIKSKMPYVILKYAMTMDGETATSIGESKWITGEKARQNVHRLRSEVMAVMTGIGTVLKDNPMMNVRLSETGFNLNVRQPVRVVLDSHLRIPFDSNLVKTAGMAETEASEYGKVIVFCGTNLTSEEKSKKKLLEDAGVQVIETEEKLSVDGHKLNLYAVMERLGEMGIDSVMVESGGRLNAGLLFEAAGNIAGKSLVNEVHVYVAPKIFGNDGKRIFSPVRGMGINFPKDAPEFSSPKIEIFGNDVLLKYKMPVNHG